MLCASAPSANILIRRSSSILASPPERTRLRDPAHGLSKCADREVGAGGWRLSVPTRDPDGPAARLASSFDVAPAVADHHALAQAYPPASGRLKEHPGPGLPAHTAVRVVVWADQHVVHRKATAQLVVDGVDRAPVTVAARNIRLVG